VVLCLSDWLTISFDTTTGCGIACAWKIGSFGNISARRFAMTFARIRGKKSTWKGLAFLIIMNLMTSGRFSRRMAKRYTFPVTGSRKSRTTVSRMGDFHSFIAFEVISLHQDQSAHNGPHPTPRFRAAEIHAGAALIQPE
jgi:hypothetical protein